MSTALKCQVSLGQFTGEYAVRVQSYDGKWVSLFAPAETIELLEEIDENHSVDGYIEVEVVDQRGGLTLVRLPRPTLENGEHLTVKEEAIQQEA